MPSNQYNSWRTGIQIDNIYPVGSIYMSVNPTNPGQLFGGSWEAIAQGTFLISAGTDYVVQNNYGSNTHTHNTSTATSGGPSNNTSGSTAITVAQMPSHNHGSAGGHSHTRGSMNITGSTKWISADAVWSSAADGAFRGYTGDGGSIANVARSGTAAGYRFTFNGASGWSGSTSSDGAHTHSSNGSGSGHTHTLSSHTHSIPTTTTDSASNIPPSLAVYMWQRTG